jgi:hypothetical protein
MIILLAAREIAPSSVQIAVLMLHLKDISEGKLNANVAYSVLGLCDESERDAYLSDLKLFRPSCRDLVRCKGGSSRACGQRVMYGKDSCSYHMRKKKYEDKRENK